MQKTFSRLSRQSTGANTTSLTTKIFPTPAPKLITLQYQIKSHHFSSSALKSRIIPSPITSSFSQCFRTKETQAVKASKKSVPKRFFATSGGKVIDAAPPPPPPPNSGGGNGMWLLLTAALVGGGVYYRNEISDYFGGSGKKSEGDGASKGDSGAKPVTQAVEKLNTQDLKKDVVDAEERLKKAEKQAEVKVEVQKAAASAEKKVENASASKNQEVDWKAVREEIVKLLDDPNYDDGSYGPVFVRLAWHNAGTYDKKTGKGGSEGACMRFEAEGGWGANAGLDVARARLEPIKKKFPGITYSDLWSYAGTVAIEEMGGPEMKWRPGRKDYVAEENVLPLGLLPDADGREHKETPQDHVRFIFNRMGFNDQEMVALIGGHALGRCHTNRSGFWGPWTYAPTTMSNEFFRLLLEETWSKKKTHQGKEWTGPEQYENKTGELMMLPTDMCLVWDPKFKKYVELYAKDQAKFDQDFAKAWMKLQELGVKKFHGWRRYIFFGPRE